MKYFGLLVCTFLFISCSNDQQRDDVQEEETEDRIYIPEPPEFPEYNTWSVSDIEENINRFTIEQWSEEIKSGDPDLEVIIDTNFYDPSGDTLIYVYSIKNKEYEGYSRVYSMGEKVLRQYYFRDGEILGYTAYYDEEGQIIKEVGLTPSQPFQSNQISQQEYRNYVGGILDTTTSFWVEPKMTFNGNNDPIISVYFGGQAANADKYSVYMDYMMLEEIKEKDSAVSEEPLVELPIKYDVFYEWFNLKIEATKIMIQNGDTAFVTRPVQRRLYPKDF